MEGKKPLVVLSGPTAVGKTSLGIALAKKVDGEIISADSMQVYRGMDIGTAKTRAEMRQGIPHHMIDILDPSESFNVVRFQQLAKQALTEIWGNAHLPIVVGGTGFYIQALLYDIDFTLNEEHPEIRQEWEQYAAQYGPEKLHDVLREVDPESAQKIHPNNQRRVIRALEYFQLTGEKISTHNQRERQKESPYEYRYFVLCEDRDQLYAAIDHRVDQMMAEGLLEEVEGLREKGYDRSLVSMQGLGYRELSAYLDGEMTLPEAVDQIKQDTRHFAKRQITWFKRERQVIWLNKTTLGSEEAILQEMLRQMEGMI